MKTLILIVSLIVAIQSCQNKIEDKKISDAAKEKWIKHIDSLSQPILYPSQLGPVNRDKYLSLFSSGYKRANERQTASEINDEITDFMDAKNAIEYVPDSLKLEKQKNEKLKSLILKLQSEDFPILRKNYVKLSSDKLWEKDIKAIPGGKNCTDITFIGGIFASHGNIKDFHSGIAESVTDLRFKRINYKWVQHDDEFTYFNLDSKKDNEL